MDVPTLRVIITASRAAGGCDDEERFSLGGAAHEPQREGTAAWVRAGEQKTCWTKPLPQVPGLWAFIGLGSFRRDAELSPARQR